MIELLPILVGVVVGYAIWFVAVRPRQLRDHERKRRRMGLPPKHRLPEDES